MAPPGLPSGSGRPCCVLTAHRARMARSAHGALEQLRLALRAMLKAAISNFEPTGKHAVLEDHQV